jgi:GNAT superfamily N-acetyltransferase
LPVGVDVEIAPVTADRWPDLVDLFERKGPRGGTPMTAGCWCMWWRERGRSRARNKQAMEALVRDGREPGLLAYEEGVPVGWVSLGPREDFGQLVRSRAYRPVDDDEGVWALVCFYVPPTEKRRGVASALLDAAVEHAFARGAASLEAYPGEPSHYMGLRESFERRGFRPVRSAGKRTVMRLPARAGRRR